MAEMSKKDSIIQAIKFALFSASAGIVQVLSFTLLNELIVPNINVDNEKVMNILSSEYGVCYLIALVLSVIWNFTFNRKYTFKSATNVPIAMLKVFGFYCVFTPVSTVLGELFSRVFTADYAEYVILGVTMLANMITEFIFCKKVVYKDSMNTLNQEDEDDGEEESHEDSEKEQTEEEKKAEEKAEREAEKEAEEEEREAIRKAKKKARKLEKKKIKKAKKKAKKKEKKEMKKAKKKAEKKAAKEAKKDAEKKAKKAAKESEE